MILLGLPYVTIFVSAHRIFVDRPEDALLEKLTRNGHGVNEESTDFNMVYDKNVDTEKFLENGLRRKKR